MVYAEDTRTQAEKDRELHEWVQAHTVDYRPKQATDTMPPEGPGGSYGSGGADDDDSKKVPLWLEILCIVIGVIIGSFISNLIF